MDRVAVVLRLQWLAYWRRLERVGPASKANVGILIVLGAIVVSKYLRYLPTLRVHLGQDRTAEYEELLGAMFLVWLLPVLAGSRRSLSARGLIHFPLSVAEQLLIKAGSVFVSPVSWVLILCSLALCYPLSAAPHFVPGLAAVLLLLLLAVAAALLAADVIAGVTGRTAILVGATTGLVAIAASGVIPESGLAPHALAARAAISPQPWRSVAGLGVMTAIALGLCTWTFADRLRGGDRRRAWLRSNRGRLEFPGRFGALIQKDLRYWRRSLDLYFAVPIALITGIYLVTAAAPSRLSVLIASIALLVPLGSLAFNSFGFETPAGFDRYKLLPLSGRDVLLGKNLAWAIIAAAAFLSILPLALWKAGPAAGAAAGIEVVLLGLAYLSWGNWMSVAYPVRMEAYRLSSGGPIAEATLGMLFASLPGVLAVILASQERALGIWAIAGLLPVYAFLYVRSLSWAGRRLEQGWTAVRAHLS